MLAQYPFKLRRTDALLVLEARPAILAQEHLLIADVRCKAETDRRGREGERVTEVGRKTRKEREQREEQSDRMTGGKKESGGVNDTKGEERRIDKEEDRCRDETGQW